MPLLPLTPAQTDPCEHSLAEFDEWYEAHFDYVWRSLKRLGVRTADLGDITHDVFVVAWRQRHHFDPERPVRPWLFGVCFRVSSSYRRRAWFRHALMTADVEDADWRPSPERSAVLRDELEAVQRALVRVPLKQRAVLLLHDFDEIPALEVARALGIPLKTVYSRLDAARKHFRQFYRLQELTRAAPAAVTATPGECP